LLQSARELDRVFAFVAAHTAGRATFPSMPACSIIGMLDTRQQRPQENLSDIEG
jgi:hypothetical protein